MERIKAISWKVIIYWFVVMSIMNVYIIPKFINNQSITTRRIIIGITVSLIVSFVMGLLTAPKPKEDNQ